MRLESGYALGGGSSGATGAESMSSVTREGSATMGDASARSRCATAAVMVRSQLDIASQQSAWVRDAQSFTGSAPACDIAPIAIPGIAPIAVVAVVACDAHATRPPARVRCSIERQVSRAKIARTAVDEGDAG